MACTVPPADEIVASACSSAPSWRAQIVTRTPSAARATADASPSPLDEAVTRADLPLIPRSMPGDPKAAAVRPPSRAAASEPRLRLDDVERMVHEVERLGSALGRHHDVLDAGAEAARQVDPRLDRERVTRRQRHA